MSIVIADTETHQVKKDLARTKCTSCGETVKKRDEYVVLENGVWQHKLCAGMEQNLTVCPDCFMVSRDCDCA
jgi:hypothetical protein